MAKLDTQSWIAHDNEYKTISNLESSKQRIREYDEINQFSKNGFEKVVLDIQGKVKTHIDIGCGAGWLLIKTSPYFEKVIGIDPSETAIGIATEITKNIPNISFLTGDMVESIKSIHLNEPAFFTPGVVLSHIEDYHVKKLLQLLNNVPNGSVLYFDELHSENIQQNMWHVRSKKWWSNNLPEWDLDFMVRDNDVHSGIYGKKVGVSKRTKHYKMTPIENIKWTANGLKNKTKRIVRAVKRKFFKNEKRS